MSLLEILWSASCAKAPGIVDSLTLNLLWLKKKDLRKDYLAKKKKREAKILFTPFKFEAAFKFAS